MILMEGRRAGRILGSALSLVGALVGCGDDGRGADEDGAAIEVVATVFPLADAVRAIGSDRVDVVELSEPGVEPHDIELTSDQVDRLLDADLVVHVGGGFQPAVDDALDGRDGPILDLADAVELDDRDPHFWLDPVRYAQAIDHIADVLAEVDPTAADDHRSSGDAHRAAIEALHDEYASALAHCERRVIVTAHEAFGYLADRYGLDERALAGTEPEHEPDPAALAAAIDEIGREGLTTVFAEPLVPDDVARTVAREAGVDVGVLDPAESGGRGDYAEVMRSNLSALVAALGCRTG
jgi:zinc transport system substrate-binding protein